MRSNASCSNRKNKQEKIMGALKQEFMKRQEQGVSDADYQTACDLLLSELVYILDELLALGVSESEIEKKINKGNSNE
ncbi:MAG TPA: hypothetical protein DEP37_15455 [Algoriphagus sp.]|nr:hypothetical protein [Algoriphagus sp.]